ncbi:MAG: hypothetical protein QXU32_04505 [Nitrososphaerales archaeon]
MVNLRDVEDTMVSELKVSREEARIYTLLVNKGRMPATRISEETGLNVDVVEGVVKDLIVKGTCIEIGREYEALNPRFAITNIYRMMCFANNQELRRNKIVDQLATLLEKPYEDVRTK